MLGIPTIDKLSNEFANVLLNHRKRLLQLWRIAAHYRVDTHLPIEETPQLEPIAKLIRMHPASYFKTQSRQG